jgi:hypothetical protein
MGLGRLWDTVGFARYTHPRTSLRGAWIINRVVDNINIAKDVPHSCPSGATGLAQGSCPCRLRINRACLSGATTTSSMVRSWPLPFGSQGRVKSTYPAWERRCSARPYDCQPPSWVTALVAGATVARGTGAPLSGARPERSGLQPWPAYRDATVWASHSRWWARAVATVGVGRRAANRN